MKKKGLVIYSNKYKDLVKSTNSLLFNVKKNILEESKIDFNIDFYYLLTDIDTFMTTILVDGESSKIMAMQGLENNIVFNKAKIENEILRYYSSEFTELNLYLGHGLFLTNNRWYTDGFSELIAYKTMLKLGYDSLANEKFIKGRYEKEYLKYKEHDNLLDWAINRELAPYFNPLIGEKYSYNIDSGQYGRAFWFFKELIDQYSIEIIHKIHQHFNNPKIEVSRDDLLNYMSKITGEDIKIRISKY